MRRQHASQEKSSAQQHVVALVERQTRDTVATLKALLKAAEDGRVRGIVFGVRYRSGNPDWDVGATGDYAKDSLAALGLTSKLWGRINARHDQDDG